MGSGTSKASGVPPSPDSAIYKIMKEKGGDDCVKFALIWEDKFGFPQGRSLSVNQLNKVKQLMDGNWEKKKNKKKIKKAQSALIKGLKNKNFPAGSFVCLKYCNQSEKKVKVKRDIRDGKRKLF
ncbi:hypothetical protein ILYODFUR_033872 [Ilyodon furcidens]|uniref:Uncharacterized protein n=1 Tax=Ilyodon furcidens TaxID=33524 RepID=A0ABV0UP51_9TELE